MTEQQRKHISEILPLFLIGASLIVYSVFATIAFGQLSGRVQRMNIQWTVGDVCEARTILDGAFEDARSVCFYSVYADVDVLLDGEPVYSFHKPSGEQLTKAAPSIWNEVFLPPESAGSLLTIRTSTPYAQYRSNTPDVYAGAVLDVDQFLFIKTMPRFVAALAILLIGIVFSIIAVFLRFYDISGNSGLYSLSLFIVVFAVFLAAQQTSILLKLYSGTSYILIDGVAFMLSPVMYTRYMMREYKGVRKRVALIMNAASIIICGVTVLLQLLRVWDLPEMLQPARILSFFVIAYAIVLELQQHSRRIVLCLIGLLALYTLIDYYLSGALTWPIYLTVISYIYILMHRIVMALLRSHMQQVRLETALAVSKSEIATVQITSHFFYHTLDSIRALIHFDSDRAYKMTGDFAKYIRYRVDGVERMRETVPFSRELRSIRAYTDIKKAQLGERFRITFEVETEDFEILPLTVQPLVENSVIHAVQRRREGGAVRVVCRETESGYYIAVIDNGADRDYVPEPQQNEKRSTAIENINTRLGYYGIAPVNFEDNDLGGKTAQITYPKNISRKGRSADEGNIGG